MSFLLLLLRHPTACALLSGLLLVLCFPRLHLSLVAWVALAPLLAVCTYRRSRARLFLYGYLAGLVFFAGTLYWIVPVMRRYGHLSWPAALAVLVFLVLFLALHLGLFTLALGELGRRWHHAALWFAPFLWVAVEWIRTYIFGGFPWNLLGYALAPHTGWVQLSAYTGIYGVSFLVVMVNAMVAAWWLTPTRRRGISLGLMAVVLGGAWAWGWRLPPVETTAEVILVQTNLPQQQEFDPQWVHRHPEEMEDIEQRTRAAVRDYPGSNAPLVVWPEVPVSIYFHHDPLIRGRLLGLAQATRSDFIVGVVDYRPDADGVRHPYNSAVLLSPAGGFVRQYDKIHLVPFGEYLPLRRWLRVLGRLVQEVSDFQPGQQPVVMPARQGRLAVFICYEAIFPALVREFVERGAEVLVNISNDGWFGRSAAPAQHLNMARVRAVETRRFLLRATNTGITVVVDPYGRVVARAPTHTRTVLRASFAPQRGSTLYVRYGDWFAALSVLVGVAALARKFWIEAVEGNQDEDN